MKKLMKAKIVLAIFACALMGSAYAASSVDVNIPLEKTNGGETTLAKEAKGKKAIVVDIWATWCPHCTQYLPTLKKKEAKWNKDVAFVALNVDSKVKAEKYRDGASFAWVVEPKDKPYSKKALDIRGYPHLVVLSPQGKVMFRGHPAEEGWEEALRELGAKK